MRITTKSHASALILMAALLLAACGGSGADDSTTTTAPAPTEADASSSTTTQPSPSGSSAEEMADNMAEDLEDMQASVGGGSATLTVGDQTWTFDSVLCAFGEEQTGQEGAEFNLSAIQNGLQLYASIDSFGHSVSLNDIDDFENPSVSLEAGGPFAAMLGGEDEFIVLDGKNVSASTLFVDDLTDAMEGVEGTLEATCP
jgi:hypothetical protein